MRHRPERALLVFVWAAACACRTPRQAATSSSSSSSSDDILAVVDGARIGRAAVLSQMRRTGQGARAALDHLIEDEVLVAEARRQLGDEDPELLETRDRAAVQLMLERELEPRIEKSAIPDATLRALYDKAHSVFVHPRLVEIALLSVYTGPRMKDEPRARAFDTARALEATLRVRPSATPEDWKAIANDPAWRDRRVKFSHLWQALDEPFPADVGRPVAALAHPGDTTPLIVSESGYHLARYLGERPPENTTFDAAKSQLRDEIYLPWRQTQFLEWVAATANPHRIEGFPERLAPDPTP